LSNEMVKSLRSDSQSSSGDKFMNLGP